MQTLRFAAFECSSLLSVTIDSDFTALPAPSTETLHLTLMSISKISSLRSSILQGCQHHWHLQNQLTATARNIYNVKRLGC